MGIFGLFSKGWDHYYRKGEEFLRDGRAAEARSLLETAREKLPAEKSDMLPAIEEKLREAKNALALMNIAEAEACLAAGDFEKGVEHAAFAATLAEDGAIRQMAEKIALEKKPSVQVPAEDSASASCGGSCCGSGNTAPDKDFPVEDPGEEEFEILVCALPGDLPGRYRAMGEKFAEAFLASRRGEVIGAAKLFEKLLSEGENDILLYELSLVWHQAGRRRSAENLLKKGLELRRDNPLIPFALVDLFAEEGRWQEARETLEGMIASGVETEQATLLLAELLGSMGEQPAALELLAPLLKTGVQRQAAEKIVPILHSLGRADEAKTVARQYLKGCR